MAYATQVTISTGNRVSLNYQSQEVSVTLTYQLEREDSDILRIVREKTAELAQAHQTAWQTLRDAKVAAVEVEKELAKEKLASEPIKAQKTEETPAPESAPATAETLPAIAPLIAPGQVTALCLLLDQAQWSVQGRQAYLRDRCECESIEELTAPQATEWLLDLQRAARVTAQTHRLNATLNGAH